MGSDYNAEAELLALQKNFDDYIAESKELEQELEQEVLNLQKKLDESSASNSALVLRLESVTPQLLALEQEIHQLRSKIEEEVIRRRQAEQEQDKADSARRAAESTAQRLQEENDTLHEELAFQSSELEEARNSIDELILRHEEECSRIQREMRDRPASLTLSADAPIVEAPNQHNGHSQTGSSEQAEYIKSLEDELEIVTEELIDTQKKLTQSELQSMEADQAKKRISSELEETITKLDKALEGLATQTQVIENLEMAVSNLGGENIALVKQVESLQNELQLSNEEIELVQEVLVKMEQEKNLIDSRTSEDIQILQRIASDFSNSDLKSLANAALARIDKYQTMLNEKDEAMQSLDADVEKIKFRLSEVECLLHKEQRLLEESREENVKLRHLISCDERRNVQEPHDSQNASLSFDLEQLKIELSLTKEKLGTAEINLRKGEAELQLLQTQLSTLQSSMAEQQQSYRESLAEKEMQLSLLQHEPSLHVVTTQSKSQTAVQSAPIFSPAARSILHHQDESLESTFSTKINEALDGVDINRIATELRNLAAKSHRMREHNALLLNQILSLQGNIQVCCRIRPLSAVESRNNIEVAVEPLSETEVGCFDGKTKTWKSFVFDKVWGPDQDQQDVFLDVEPLSLSVVDGYNCCIFAYGQTGSGKTYSMQGSLDDGGGISQRTILKILSLLQQRGIQAKLSKQLRHDEEGNVTESSFEFSITVGMLEIYNEGVYDLLASLNEDEGNRSTYQKENLDIRKDVAGRTYVENLTKSPVYSLEDVMRLLQMGNSARATASTNLNERSSRSHMVLQIEVNCGIVGQPGNQGKLFLVDLAGSERVRNSGVSGKELKEAQYINKSLSALSDVMEALDRKATHVPYRNSKLTHLLQDSLGGNSKTMMVVTVSPGSESYQETQYALQFSSRVRNINLGKAQRNVASKNLEEKIKSLTQEMKSLQKAKEASEAMLQSLRKEHQRVQEQLATAKQTRPSSHQETLTLAALRRSNDEMTNRWQKQKDLCDKFSIQLESHQNELRKNQQQVLQLTKEHAVLNNKLQQKEFELNEAKKDLRMSKDALTAANLRNRRSQIMGASVKSSVNGGTADEASKPSYSMNLEESFNKSLQISSTTSHVAVRYPVPIRASKYLSIEGNVAKNDKNEHNSERMILNSRSPNCSGESIHSLSPLSSMPGKVTSPLALGLDAAGATKVPAPDYTVSEMREKLVKLFQKHDPPKARRVDEILRKFKGRESFLLEKVVEKYEGDCVSQNWDTNSVASSCVGSPVRRSELALERHKERIRKSLDLRKNLKSR